jgi:hemolysin III
MPYKTDPKAPPTRTGEIIANSITHGIGLVLSVAGLVILIVRALKLGSGWHLAGYLVFGISAILLYLSSTLYHSFARLPAKAFFQRLDHSAIYFLIAGTYTPFLFTTLRNGWGWSIFGIIWGLALVGLILKIGFKTRFEKPSVWLYLAMGWAGVVVFWQGLEKMTTASVVFLLLGGLAYSLGVIFYRWRSLRFSHAIWHLFVLAGTIFHYFSVLNLTPNPVH